MNTDKIRGEIARLEGYIATRERAQAQDRAQLEKLQKQLRAGKTVEVPEHLLLAMRLIVNHIPQATLDGYINESPNIAAAMKRLGVDDSEWTFSLYKQLNSALGPIGPVSYIGL